MEVSYTKMHGAGNRILVVDQRNVTASPPDVAQLRLLGNAETGPGFDQLMWVSASANPECAASYRIFNADGSEVEQCGNGVRCVARYLANQAGHPQQFTLQSPSGPVDASIDDEGRVTVSMGVPEFEPAAIPFVADTRAERYELSVDGVEYDICAVSMGNPHCVLQVDDVTTAPVESLGPAIETHPRFPQKTNVGFVCITGRDSVDLRVFERGVGETAACGTGACAAVVVCQRLGLLDDTVRVRLPGGQLVVSWRGGSEPAWLTGDAETISEGFMDL